MEMEKEEKNFFRLLLLLEGEELVQRKLDELKKEMKKRKEVKEK